MNKRGQFYIVAAIIMILVLSSLASVSTYVIAKSKSKSVRDLSNELNEETSRIIDYGIYNKENLSSLMYNFTQKDFADYLLHKSPGTNITFIYGNKNELNAVQYFWGGSGQVSIGRASYRTNEISGENLPVTILEQEGLLNVTLLKKDYYFKLRENEMFYFAIIKEENGEISVETNQDK